MKTAILVDGAFYVKRYRVLATPEKQTPEAMARGLMAAAWQLIRKANPHTHKDRQLYRIFFYDCQPIKHYAGPHPISQKPYRIEDHGNHDFRAKLHTQLSHQRKVALRLGTLSPKMGRWVVTPSGIKALRTGTPFLELDPREVYFEVKQSGVDMRIGLDIAAISTQHAVDQIILIAGDADFVPAAKVARRNGIDFVLDPMWQHVQEELLLHVDGIASVFPKPQR